MLAERAYAKVNLTLDVNFKRPDGYHDIDMVMQTIDLSDLIWLEEISGGGIKIESNVSYLPLDKRNLAYAATEVFRQETGITTGVRIRIDKQIPVAAGLGGGSADAAAVLRGLNKLWKTGLSTDNLAEMGASVGSDVPFLVYEGCGVATGRGEQVRLVRHPTKAWIVLVRPTVFVSTAAIYGACESFQTRLEPSSKAMVEALKQGDLDRTAGLISNDLTPVAERLYPEIAEMRERLEGVTRSTVYMSGSGPTLFCLAPNETVAHRYYNAINGFAKEVYLSRFI
ncbi:4-(cytidine 5'-diphospho)-2-C-methyl-D-erythritol kinase [Alicyclobacillus sp. SO9]|uniref:4-(cytidine 5'-diphospho)-2-C-methyl-D-erythritol kinase n=1 Tax=Alicyclobacillus sp. SO9 TaxID=2665646 RepID=UPI0018E7465E|nr:4-(cytidine 5'-diphospho)-2-C-methyl-D-erythritol kinase [Alicyclobacillus sp. SO9]QQE79400.1 4-(cytidine 5'-diphospho)-2-C-methyl-D-erythritol kinase [Alicyclobacillus sp. SO9]